MEAANTLAKLMREIRPKAEAPTKEAVAAEAIADTENKVPMFIMQVANIIELVIFWLACSDRHLNQLHQKDGLHTAWPLPNTAPRLTPWPMPATYHFCSKPHLSMTALEAPCL